MPTRGCPGKCFVNLAAFACGYCETDDLPKPSLSDTLTINQTLVIIPPPLFGQAVSLREIQTAPHLFALAVEKNHIWSNSTKDIIPPLS
jgi:hypothetical protein